MSIKVRVRYEGIKTKLTYDELEDNKMYRIIDTRVSYEKCLGAYVIKRGSRFVLINPEKGTITFHNYEYWVTEDAVTFEECPKGTAIVLEQ